MDTSLIDANVHPKLVSIRIKGIFLLKGKFLLTKENRQINTNEII